MFCKSFLGLNTLWFDPLMSVVNYSFDTFLNFAKLEVSVKLKINMK